jgi:pimeloyl-ACP methyl ester carboxylesterase
MPDFSPLTTYSGERYGDPKLLRRLARVTIPARFVWGEDDPVAPFGFGKIYAEAYANSEFHGLPGAGHMPALQAPTETYALIDEFLLARHR